MKKSLIATALLLSAAASMAQEATVFNDHTTRSALSRDDVRQQVQAALARGERLSWGEAMIESPARQAPAARATLTREEVKAGVIAALSRGQRLSTGEASL
jgi:peroxiredoxin family protein